VVVEWAGRGIRVSAVAPGTINTERVKRLPEVPSGPEYLEEIKKAHPMGRLGEPEEVATPFFSWLPMRHHSSPARFSPWMVDTWLSKVPITETISG
jgi:NAD(P)-dependent dehydrogenase (short-subunit alcohol dehydrogenase family)